MTNRAGRAEKRDLRGRKPGGKPSRSGNRAAGGGDRAEGAANTGGGGGFFGSQVLPRPLLPMITQFRGSTRKSRVRARSIKGRSIFLGQFHSKSARGLKRPKRAWARRRSRLRRARSSVSERAISSSS